jgi:UDP-N-acetylmuramate dehydrogenase
LIDSIGMRGFRIGTAAVSEKHANFIQADSGGSADDVRRVIDAVRAAVAQRTGVELAIEVRWISD